MRSNMSSMVRRSLDQSSHGIVIDMTTPMIEPAVVIIHQNVGALDRKVESA